LGAEDVIEKSFDMQKIIQITKNLVEKRSLKRQKDNLTKNLLEKYEILGESNEIVKLKAIIEKVAPTNASILILGETGVGKELVARNIHIRSQRSDSPYIKVNCAALPGELIESELFGHEKGSFTGAISTKKGQFEMADNGTLFLDEIGDMTLHAQAKVLRALESGEIMKIGGDNEIHVDVRLITATNQNIKELIHSKLFREDLFHRINVVEIKVPSLAERISDIPLLASHFLELYCYENNMPVRIIDRSAEKYLMNCAWPGNIRQLRHTIEKIIVLSDSKVINAEIVEKILKQPDLINDKLCENEDFDALQLYDKKKYFEKNYIITALNKNHWHITKTASELGMDRSTLFRKMKSLDIKR
jgi:two-component system nitrogen regulation response regulator NtrX